MKKLRAISYIVLLLAISGSLKSQAQPAPFQLYLEPVSITGLQGMQAFAFGQHDGKWLLLGGRLDGLHRRQPWATFDIAGQNNLLTVVDPVTQQFWTASITSLPVPVQEQLRSTNMEFHQQGNMLYLMGGYGYSNTQADHTTYPYLTAIDLQVVVPAIISGNPVNSGFRQVQDEEFAVTGGYLNKIYDTWYITGGQRFEGRYNPMNNPTFVQEYTNSIRKFQLADDGTTISITHLPTLTDSVNLHRRDYNVAPQILPDGQEGLTAFSGVFQASVDLPYLNCVNIDSNGYTVNNDFAQYYNHYHCAHIPIFSEDENEMHTVFFGGIAQYYDSLGILVQNNNVPFVKTIARVTRTANGSMSEYKMPVELPGLMGAGSEFIPLENLPRYSNEVVKLDDLPEDTSLVGYVYGGIHSSAPNIFWINDGTQSTAGNTIFKVYLIKNLLSAVHELNQQSTGSLHLQVYPNPNNGILYMKFFLKTSSDVTIHLSDLNGKTLHRSLHPNLPSGPTVLKQSIDTLGTGGVFLLSVETKDEKVSQKIIVEP